MYLAPGARYIHLKDKLFRTEGVCINSSILQHLSSIIVQPMHIIATVTLGRREYLFAASKLLFLVVTC
uniref:Uncharacterized protein n=1 Tax=Aegilops tauschii subsp. strangulata TaxID=200361 RepID=A0A453FK78_AEGTS